MPRFQRALLKDVTFLEHSERMKKRLSVCNEEQREKEKERKIERSTKEAKEKERERDGERRRGHKGQKVNRQKNVSGIFTFTMNVIMCECACVE